MPPLKSSDYKTHPFPADFVVEKSVTLQCCNMGEGNNKFYLMELHSGNGSGYRLYTSYGRTGRAGKEEERIASKSELEKEWDRLLKDKNRKGYREVQMAVTSVGSTEGNKKVLSTDVKQAAPAAIKTQSQLRPEVRTLVERLYKEAGQACTSQLNANVNATHKNPLGTLTTTQIKQGQNLLKVINETLTNKPNLVDSIDDEVIALTNAFYSAIPHQIPLRPRDPDGRRDWLKRFCLNRSSILDEKRDFLDVLLDVEGLIAGFESDDVDKKYEQINCSFEPCAPSSDDFKAVDHFITSTQSQHHYWKLKVKNVWKMASKAQQFYSDRMAAIGNIQPLFHGSRPANILGISQKGLLLRPPGAYVTGSMFGNGLYFANQSTKSSQYATARFGGGSGYGDTYFMFVADVALGRIKEYFDSQGHLQKAPVGYDSVKGCKGRSLVHDEFIVYDIRQNQLQYLVEFSQ